MRTQVIQFNNIIETIYNLPLEEKIEIKNLLEHNIADSRRNEIADNFKKTQAEHKSGKLKFSSKPELFINRTKVLIDSIITNPRLKPGVKRIPYIWA